jgi:hypothetical protein
MGKARGWRTCMSKISFPAYDSWWRERYPRTELENIFTRITPYYRQAQFMQVPTLGDLNYFDVAMCPRYTELGQILNLWVAVDAAQTQDRERSLYLFRRDG